MDVAVRSSSQKLAWDKLGHGDGLPLRVGCTGNKDREEDRGRLAGRVRLQVFRSCLEVRHQALQNEVQRLEKRFAVSVMLA